MTIKRILAAFIKDEQGQDLIEYALLAACIGLGAVTAMTGLSTVLGDKLTSTGAAVTAAS